MKVRTREQRRGRAQPTRWCSTNSSGLPSRTLAPSYRSSPTSRRCWAGLLRPDNLFTVKLPRSGAPRGQVSMNRIAPTILKPVTNALGEVCNVDAFPFCDLPPQQQVLFELRLSLVVI